MQNVLPAFRFGFVEVGIRLRKRAKQLAVLALEVQAKSRVQRVAGFVTQNAHALLVRAALQLQHLPAFELHQARVGEVKRDGDPRHAIGRKPLFRQPNMGFKANSARIQLAIKPLDVRFEKRALDFDWQIADAQVKQLLVAETLPGESVAHGGTF